MTGNLHFNCIQYLVYIHILHVRLILPKMDVNANAYLAHLQKLSECVSADTKWYELLHKQVRKIPDEAVFAMGDKNNKRILMKYVRAENFKKYSDIESALKSVGEGEIIINFTELQLFGVFSIEAYYQFIQNLQGDVGDETRTTVDYYPRQIILSGWPQKVVFLCNGDDDIIARVRGYVHDYFHEDITVARKGNETTIAVQKPLMKNSESAKEAFQEFMKYISKTAGDACLRNLGLRMDREEIVNNISYQSCLMPDAKNIGCMTDLLRELHSIRAINFIVQINGNHHNINLGAGNIINNNNNIDPYEIVKNWIRVNPPNNRERKTDYYQRYVDAKLGDVADSVFGKLVIQQGYETRKTKIGREWTKK